MTRNILLIEPSIHEVGIKLFTEEFNVIYAPNGQEDTLIEYINDYNIHALIIRLEQVTAKILESCPTLEVIGRHGIGVENINIKKATELGIAVLNVPNENYTTVVEHTVLLMLALSRNIILNNTKVKEGEWSFRDKHVSTEISGKNILVIGMGLIGQEVAKKVHHFDMNVYGYDPYVNDTIFKSLKVHKVESLTDELNKFDFISIHTPLTQDTRNLISFNEINNMKPSAVIINVSRGGVINEEALYNGLANNKIKGCGLDVFEEEPPGVSKLLSLDNVVVTPHIAGVSKESKYRTSESLAKNVIKYLKGESPDNVVNHKELNN